MKLIYQLKRVSFDITLFLILLFFLYFSPSIPTGGQLILYKGLLVSAGFMHGHITRKLAFPYIDFNKDCDPLNKILVIVIYASFILGWSRGG